MLKTTIVKIDDEEITIKEVLYKQIMQFSSEKSEAAKQLITLSTDMSDEQFDELSMRKGLILTKAINKLNGLDSKDFQ